MTESIKLNNLSLVERIKMVLQEVTERQTNHDFDTDMAVRAQRTAELYQIIDGIGKDESKLEILQTKQRLRDKMQEMESDIKVQVSQLLAEETIEKDQGKRNVKHCPLKTIQGTFHPREIHLKQLSSNRSFSSAARWKSDSQHSYILTKNQNLEHRSTQPNRIRKPEMAVKTYASFTGKSKHTKNLSASKIYLERGEPVIQYDNLSSTMSQDQLRNNLEEQSYRKSHSDEKYKPCDKKFGTEVSNRQHLFPELSQASKINESKQVRNYELEKIYKSKSVQTDKHITWKSSRRKSNDRHKVEKSSKVTEKQRFSDSGKSPYAHPMTKSHPPRRRISVSSDVDYDNLDQVHDKSEPVFKINDRMNDCLIESIRHLESRSQNEIIHNLGHLHEPLTAHDMEEADQPMNNINILDTVNRFLDDTRNEQDIAALYTALAILQETNIQNLYNSSGDKLRDTDKNLLEKLIVDVIYEDLQDLIHSPGKTNASNQSSDAEDSSASNVQQAVEQYSEHEESELPAPKDEINIITPDLSPENSFPSSSSSLSSSPCIVNKPLPSTPLLSEPESTSEEIVQHSQSHEAGNVNSHVVTPDLTPPLSHSPKYYVATPLSSPQPPNVPESESCEEEENKKSVRDASVQVSKLSSSESMIGTIATSISDTTDEFLSDGELLLKSYGQVPLPTRQRKNTVTIQDYPTDKAMSQISKSPLSEGEVPLITTKRTILNQKHPFQIIDSSIDETQLQIPTNSTFEQIWDDISEGQVIPQHIKRNFKPVLLNQTSTFNASQYQRQLSHTLSEGEIISIPQAETTPFKSPSSAKDDDFNCYMMLTNQLQNNNISVSSGEIEDDEEEKSNKNLLVEEEKDAPVLTDAEFFDEQK